MLYAPETITWFKRFEKYMPIPYLDRGKLAYGYGHSNWSGRDPIVKPGDVISEPEASALLIEVDIPYYWSEIEDGIKVDLNPYQKGALILFSYNLGPSVFLKSNLLKRINAGDKKAAAEFMKFNKSRDPETKVLEELEGLTFRRSIEMNLFREGWWNA